VVRVVWLFGRVVIRSWVVVAEAGGRRTEDVVVAYLTGLSEAQLELLLQGGLVAGGHQVQEGAQIRRIEQTARACTKAPNKSK
jgi:hypothetical protein